MIDLHCHLLPGVDDGPQTIDDSIALAKKLVEDGVKQVVVTPHMLDGVYNVTMKQLLDGLQDLQKVLQNNNIDLQVFPGADIHINSQLVKLINEETVATIANKKKYILLEPDNNIWGDIVEQVVFSLQIKSITPIITHPERYHVVQEDIWRLKSLAEANVPIQVTAASICGFFGKRVQKCSRELFKNNLAHIVASDAHGVRKRPPFMTEARKIMCKWLPKDQVEDIFDVYPKKILDGEYIQLPPPQQKKHWWFFGQRTGMINKIPHIITGLLVVVLSMSHLLFGMMHRWVSCSLFLVILFSLLIYIMYVASEDKFAIVRSHLIWVWLVVFAAMLLQIIPLPQQWLELLSSKANNIMNILGEKQQTLSLNAFFSQETFARFFCYVVLFFLVIHNARTKKKLTILTMTILGVAVMEVLYGLANRNDMLWIEKDRPRLSGTFTNRNHFGCLLAMASSAGVGLFCAIFPHNWVTATKQRKFFVGIIAFSVLITLTGTLLSQSKGAQASLAVSLALFATVFVWKKRPRLSLILTALVVVTVIIFINIQGIERWEQQDFDYSFEYRLALYKASLPMISDYPFVGVGLGNFRHIYRQYQPPSKYVFSYLHNDWLQIISEFGIIPSLLLFYIFIYFFLRTAYKLWLRKDHFYKWLGWGALCAVLVMMLHSLVDFNFLRTLSNTITVFSLAGIACVCANNRKWQETQFSLPQTVVAVFVVTIAFVGWHLLIWLRADFNYTLYQNWQNQTLGSVPQHVDSKSQALMYLKNAAQVNPNEPEYFFQRAVHILDDMQVTIIEEARKIIAESNPTLEEDNPQLFEKELEKQLLVLEVQRFPWINLQIELAYLENQKAVKLLPISPEYQTLDLLIQISKINLFFGRGKKAPQKYIDRFHESLQKVEYTAPRRPRSLLYVGKSLCIYSMIFPEKKEIYRPQIMENFRKTFFSELNYSEEMYSLTMRTFNDPALLLDITPKYYLHYNKLYDYYWRKQHFALCAQVLDKMPQLPHAPLEWKRVETKFDELEMARRLASIAEIQGNWQQRQQYVRQYKKQLQNEIAILKENAREYLKKGYYYQAYKAYQEILNYDYGNVHALLELCELSLLPELKPRIPRLPSRYYLERIAIFAKNLQQQQLNKFMQLLQEIAIDDKHTQFLTAAAHILADKNEQGKKILRELSKDQDFFRKWRQAHLVWYFFTRAEKGQSSANEKLYNIVPSFQKVPDTMHNCHISFSEKLLLHGYDINDNKIDFVWEFRDYIKGYVIVQFFDKDFGYISRYVPRFSLNNRRYAIDFCRYGEVLTTNALIPQNALYMRMYCIDGKKRLPTEIGNNSFFTKIRQDVIKGKTHI